MVGLLGLIVFLLTHHRHNTRRTAAQDSPAAQYA
jgi:hypothetical protein